MEVQELMFVLVDTTEQLLKLAKWKIEQRHRHPLPSGRINAFYPIIDYYGWDGRGGPVEKRGSSITLKKYDWITWDKFETDYLNKKIMSKEEIYEAMLKKWV